MTTPQKYESSHPPVATITLVLPLFDVSPEFVGRVTEDIYAALPGGRRVLFDAHDAFEGHTRLPIQEVLIRVKRDGIGSVADWLAEEAKRGTQRVFVTLGQFTTPNSSARIVPRLAEALSDRDVACLICVPPLTASPLSALAIRALASGDRVRTVACVAPDRVDPSTQWSLVEALTALKAVAGDRLGVFANRLDLTEGFEDHVVPLGVVSIRLFEFGFSAEHPARDGYAAVRGFAGLREYSQLPASLDYEVEHELRAMAAQDGLVLPYVPEAFASRLTKLGDSNFGQQGRAYGAMDLYLFRDPLEDILNGDWQPRLQFGLAGHGINSFAYTYVMVSDGVAVVCQAGRGFAYGDLRQTDADWKTIMDGARRAHDAAVTHGGVPAGKLLLIVWDTMRSTAGWKLLDRAISGKSDRYAFRREHFEGDDLFRNGDDLFERAVQGGLGQHGDDRPQSGESSDDNG